MEKHVIGQVSHGGNTVDLLAYHLEVDTTKIARQRLSTAILQHRVCVTRAYAPGRLGRGIVVDVMITVPEPCAEAALDLIKPYKVNLPARASAGRNNPAPTWGEQRERIADLERQHEAATTALWAALAHTPCDGHCDRIPHLEECPHYEETA